MKNSYLQIIVIGTAVSVLALLYYFIDARSEAIFPRCPFYMLTGWLCPGCGSQRAISALLHVEIMQAIRYNIMLVVALPFLGYSAFVFLWNTMQSRKIEQSVFYSPVFPKIVLVAIIVFTIARNIPSFPFDYLKSP